MSSHVSPIKVQFCVNFDFVYKFPEFVYQNNFLVSKQVLPNKTKAFFKKYESVYHAQLCKTELSYTIRIHIQTVITDINPPRKYESVCHAQLCITVLLYAIRIHIQTVLTDINPISSVSLHINETDCRPTENSRGVLTFLPKRFQEYSGAISLIA